MAIKTIRNNKKILLIAVISFAVILTLILTTSLAKYKVTQSIRIVEGTINYKLADLNMIALYQENSNGTYNEISIMPSSGYVINEDSSYCTINGEKDTNIKLYTNDNMEHVFLNIQKGSKCYLYFDREPLTVESILAGMTKSARTSFSSAYTTATTKTVFSAEDDDGTSYYFAGNPTDNWVKFAGFYWRIIRFNGDGSIRLIYQGTKANTTGNGTQLSTTSVFNPDTVNGTLNVGYMYTKGEIHGLGTSSTIKGVLDDWYDGNLADYASYIDTKAGFCGDRQPSTSESNINGNVGSGSTYTYYGAYIRIKTNQTPSLKCVDSSDLYTISSSSKGNKALSRPIGLITADEVMYAGGVYYSNANNINYYLHTGEYYWTLSPYYSWQTCVFYVYSNGALFNGGVTAAFGVRPVINLKADTEFKTGSLGTANSPYEVVM